MKVIGVEILDKDWNSTISEVDAVLKGFEDFNSPTYQHKGIKSINDKWILLKPKQAHFCEVLYFDWKELEILQTDELI